MDKRSGWKFPLIAYLDVSIPFAIRIRFEEFKLVVLRTKLDWSHHWFHDLVYYTIWMDWIWNASLKSIVVDRSCATRVARGKMQEASVYLFMCGRRRRRTCGCCRNHSKRIATAGTRSSIQRFDGPWKSMIDFHHEYGTTNVPQWKP